MSFNLKLKKWVVPDSYWLDVNYVPNIEELIIRMASGVSGQRAAGLTNPTVPVNTLLSNFVTFFQITQILVAQNFGNFASIRNRLRSAHYPNFSGNCWLKREKKKRVPNCELIWLLVWLVKINNWDKRNLKQLPPR